MKSIEMIILDRRGCCARAHLPIAVLGRLGSVLTRVFPALVFALVLVVGLVRALVVVVVCAVLIFWVGTANVVRMLCLGPMHMAGLLGGLFVRRLAVSVVPGVWLALAVGCSLARLTAVIAAVTIAPPAVLTPSVVCLVLELVVVASL